MKQTFLFILLTAYSFTSYATIRYVTVAGDNAMDGTSWSNAYPAALLQTAIAASNAGDEVWVAGGLYIPIGTDRTAAFNMKNDVIIYGSFAGTETSVSQRIFSNGLTSILSDEIRHQWLVR